MALDQSDRNQVEALIQKLNEAREKRWTILENLNQTNRRKLSAHKVEELEGLTKTIAGTIAVNESLCALLKSFIGQYPLLVQDDGIS